MAATVVMAMAGTGATGTVTSASRATHDPCGPDRMVRPIRLP